MAVLVFGSINMDLLFPVQALPQPGQTVLGQSYRIAPGGKGMNQAVAARRAGALVRMAGAVGRDGFADLARTRLGVEGIADSDLQVAEAPTACAAIAVAEDGENIIVVASGANRLLTADGVPAEAFTGQTVAMLQLEVPVEESLRVAERTRAAGGRVVWSLAPFQIVPEAVLRAADVLVMNAPEAAALAAHFGLPAASAVPAAAERWGTAVIGTLGGAGALLGAHGQLWHCEAAKVEVVDTTGAGDALAGAVAAAIDAGLPLAEALRHGCAGGALACRALGAQESLGTKTEIADLAATLALEQLES
jgi:ribokinase